MQGQDLADKVMKLVIGGTVYRSFSGSILMTQSHFQAVVHRWSYYRWQCRKGQGADGWRKVGGERLKLEGDHEACEGCFRAALTALLISLRLNQPFFDRRMSTVIQIHKCETIGSILHTSLNNPHKHNLRPTMLIVFSS